MILVFRRMLFVLVVLGLAACGGQKSDGIISVNGLSADFALIGQVDSCHQLTAEQMSQRIQNQTEQELTAVSIVPVESDKMLQVYGQKIHPNDVVGRSTTYPGAVQYLGQCDFEKIVTDFEARYPDFEVNIVARP